MPQRELERLQAVHRFLNLKIDKDENLQEIVELAAELCETPIALITLSDEGTRYFKFKAGMDMSQHISKDAFCEHLTANELMIVPDVNHDPRFANASYVIGSPHVCFYAGIPLTTHDGHNLGSLCVMDIEARQLTAAQKRLLTVLGKRVIQIMEFESSLLILKKQYVQAKDAEIKLRSFFESGGACHLLIGKELEVIAFNKNMSVFLERIYHVELYAGILVSQILTGPALEQFIKEYQVALTGTTVKYEREVKYLNETIWWFVTFEPGYNQEGEIIGISYNAYDITERKLHEQQIMAQNNSLKNIAHIQSHELRRPVASILGLMELFKSNNYQATKEELLMMEYAAKELDDKIRNIVTFTD
jgi:signal transduction histidine kinase